MNPTSPNHALQRTAPRVTARAFCERSGIYTWASFVRSTVGHAPPSLSLGSLGDCAHPEMKILLLSALLGLVALAIPPRVSALSPVFTFEDTVAGSSAILEVTILEAAPPKTDSLIEPAVCKATVTKVLKGDKNLKEVEFRFVPYGDYAPAKLPGIIGKKYLLFFHTLEGRYWVFRPAGFTPAEESSQLAASVRQQLAKDAK